MNKRRRPGEHRVYTLERDIDHNAAPKKTCTRCKVQKPNNADFFMQVRVGSRKFIKYRSVDVCRGCLSEMARERQLAKTSNTQAEDDERFQRLVQAAKSQTPAEPNCEDDPRPGAVDEGT